VAPSQTSTGGAEMATEQIDMPLAEYAAVVNHCRLLAQLVHQNAVLERVQVAIDKAEYSDVVTPFLDPTLWTRGHQPLRRDIALMRAAQDFQAAVQKALDA
jgi:hypothetical protein